MLYNLTPLEIATIRAGLQELQKKCAQVRNGPDQGGFIGVATNDAISFTAASLLLRIDIDEVGAENAALARRGLTGM